MLETCLVAKSSMGWLWHHRLALVGMRNLVKLPKEEHILGLTNVHFEKDRICKACQAEKQVGVPHPPKSIVTTSSPLELIHMISLDRLPMLALAVTNMVLLLLMIILASRGCSLCMIRVKCKGR